MCYSARRYILKYELYAFFDSVQLLIVSLKKDELWKYRYYNTDT